tara:strand:- start:5904 stop:6086 length:183 start_codon:yes stop_codon:yes gene_type:complete
VIRAHNLAIFDITLGQGCLAMRAHVVGAKERTFPTVNRHRVAIGQFYPERLIFGYLCGFA